MPHLRAMRRAAASVAALAAVIELAASVRVLAGGPFELRLGLLDITARTASKPFLIGVLLASIAVWLIDPLLRGTIWDDRGRKIGAGS